jgi:hypothetical protein
LGWRSVSDIACNGWQESTSGFFQVRGKSGRKSRGRIRQRRA